MYNFMQIGSEVVDSTSCSKKLSVRERLAESDSKLFGFEFFERVSSS